MIEHLTMATKLGPDNEPYKLGMWMGVFVPTFQNILGIILFLRLPKIAGHAGISGALGIVLLSCFASFLTVLSMSAVCTNGVPKSGGCYSIIKDSVGPRTGGTVGGLLFLSNTFGLAMYVIGFVEILFGLNVFSGLVAAGWTKLNIFRLGSFITTAVLFGIVYVGMKQIGRAALFFLTLVCMGLLCIYIGTLDKAINPINGSIPGFPSRFDTNWGPEYGLNDVTEDIPDDKYSFFVLFAIFFPACTDPLAGSNLSGDLLHPRESIPPGTLIAVAACTVIFSLQVIFLGGSCERDYLRFDEGGIAVSSIGWPIGELVYVGMSTSTLGAGLQSLAGAPRLLAGLGRDGLIPSLHVFYPGEDGEPKKGVLLCATLGIAIMMLGDLELVAPIITMWFLTCYAIINGSVVYCHFHAKDDPVTGKSSFDPTFHFYHWVASALGCVICMFMMFAINWWAAIVALAIGACIYALISHNLNVAAKKNEAEANPLGGEQGPADEAEMTGAETAAPGAADAADL